MSRSYHPSQVELLEPFVEAPELTISFSEPRSGKVPSPARPHPYPCPCPLTLALIPHLR